MNGPWHYREAERLLAEAPRSIDPGTAVALALGHATLAAAAATAQSSLFDDQDVQEWFAVIHEGQRSAETREGADDGDPDPDPDYGKDLDDEDDERHEDGPF